MFFGDKAQVCFFWEDDVSVGVAPVNLMRQERLKAPKP